MNAKHEDLRAKAQAATGGEWSVWREETPTPVDAAAALSLLVAETAEAGNFCGAVYMLNAGGKCPAATGCGPTSAANAAYIVASQPLAILALLADLDAAREALAEIERRHIPDQPAADNCDELTWAQKHVGRLRKIARAALARLEGKP